MVIQIAKQKGIIESVRPLIEELQISGFRFSPKNSGYFDFIKIKIYRLTLLGEMDLSGKKYCCYYSPSQSVAITVKK